MAVSSIGALLGCHQETLTEDQLCAKKVFQVVLGIIFAAGLMLAGLPLGGYLPSYCYWVGGGLAVLAGSLVLTSCLLNRKSESVAVSETPTEVSKSADTTQTIEEEKQPLASTEDQVLLLKRTIFKSEEEYALLKVGSQLTVKLMTGRLINLSIDLDNANAKQLKFYFLEKYLAIDPTIFTDKDIPVSIQIFHFVQNSRAVDSSDNRSLRVLSIQPDETISCMLFTHGVE